MSAENDRVRRELGVDLARAGFEAGVDAPIKRLMERLQPQVEGDEALLYFTSFEQFDAWHRMNSEK